MDEETKAAMKLENYLAIVRAFPPEHAVPDIDFQLINGGAKKRLSDYRGKVLVLDWWATWCGPCQEPMAEFQRVAAAHPEWKDKVVMLTLSIDDSPETAAKHLTRRGWTNAVNAWAGEGEFRSESAKIFRLRGVPTSYVIGTNGRVIANGGSGQLDRNLEGVISFGLGEKQPAIR